MKLKIRNHITGSLSDLDKSIINTIPPGGNWKNVPSSIKSKHLENIRNSGGRTTYYGRLKWDKPSYTIATYFNRPGNGCSIHPDPIKPKSKQNRLISIREAARLQSFPDDFIFKGSKSSQFTQIGNAVPVMLAYCLSKLIKGKYMIDLFCGAGGLSRGFEFNGFKSIIGVDNQSNFLETWQHNHDGEAIKCDLTDVNQINKLISSIKKQNKKISLIAGGPPCQGFSTAGYRQENDPRNKLWESYFKIIKEIKPKYFLMENVAGLLTMKAGDKNLLDLIIKAFTKIGYKVNYKKLNAENFLVPQLRRRVFVIGSLDQEVSIPEKVSSHIFTVKDAILNLPNIDINQEEKELVHNVDIKNLSNFEKYIVGKIEPEKLFELYKEDYLNQGSLF